MVDLCRVANRRRAGDEQEKRCGNETHADIMHDPSPRDTGRSYPRTDAIIVAILDQGWNPARMNLAKELENELMLRSTETGSNA